MIGFSNVSLRVGSSQLLGLTWALSPGETLAIVGGSGSGKTLILSLLLGEMKPSQGTVEVDGVSMRLLPPMVLQLYRQRVGVLFQEPRLLAHLSLLENVSLPMELRGVPRRTALQAAMDMLATAGMQSLASSLPGAVPPGMQRMAALLRSLIGQPGIVIADEPFALLDDQQRATAMHLLSAYRSPQRSLLILTNDERIAEDLDARVLRLGGVTATTAPMMTVNPMQPEGAKVKITSVAS